MDNVYYIFRIITFERFNISSGRFGAFISQIPVLLALKANLNLKALVFIYSISFILLFYGIYILCTRVLKNQAAGMSIVFLFLLCMKQSFYHTTHESHQAFVYCSLFFALMQYQERSKFIWFKFLSEALVIVLAFYTYPVSTLIILFIIAYHLIDQSNWKDFRVYLLVLLIIFLALYKAFTAKETSYEGVFLSNLTGMSFTWNAFFNYYSAKFFVNRITGLYFWLVLVFMFLLGYLIWKKEFVKLGFIVLSTFGIFSLLIIIYHEGDSNIMMERSFLPLVPIIVIPFFNEVLTIYDKYQNLTVVILVITILFTGIIRLTSEGYQFRSRLNRVEKLINKTEEYNSRKFILKKTSENIRTSIVPWPFSFTTLIISSLEDKSATKTIFLYDDPAKYEKYVGIRSPYFLGAPFWLELPVSMLNPDYFTLSDEPYILLDDS